MTEINKARLLELETIARGIAKAHETLLNSQSPSIKGIAKSEEALKEALDAYNDQVTVEVQALCLASDKPMLFALTRGFQDRLVRKVKLDSKTNIYEVDVEVDYNKDIIDIKALNKKGENLSHDNAWLKYIPTVHSLFQVAVAKALGDAEADTKGYAIKKSELGVRPDMIGKTTSILEIADIQKDGDPFSIGSLTKVLQVMSDMILGDNSPLIRRKDARFVIMMCAREGKMLTYKYANERSLFSLVFKSIHAAIISGDYAEYVKA